LAASRETNVTTSPDTSSEDQREVPAPTSEEDARRFVEQLRSTPADEILADVFSTLLTAAEVKLGRRDARLFIDLCTTMLEYADRYASDDLGKQVEKVLGQLRLGQVSAESQVLRKGNAEPNDLRSIPKPPATGAQGESPTAGRPSESPSSRLWVPGR
jgi:hypothetical protein